MQSYTFVLIKLSVYTFFNVIFGVLGSWLGRFEGMCKWLSRQQLLYQ
ncbi:hypothetical protein HMPREF3034_01268 [Prevotella sp. DNF00663]|nr:hypothetical protein HMPREF3034_01268 [Prevotella sp. DNF00663]